jgi:hypothetical protein
MKIYLSNYRDHWISGYAIMEKVLFWKTEDELYEMTPPDWLTNICEWNRKFLDKVHPKIEYVKIDKYDVWSMDNTLGKIILPMLIRLKDQKQGAPGVDDEDVPEILRSTASPEKDFEWDSDANWQLRWDWVLGEEIWAFSQLNSDWEDQYRTGVSDLSFEDNAVGRGPNHTLKIDFEGMRKHQDRMQNGFSLFGKYFQGHWT